MAVASDEARHGEQQIAKPPAYSEGNRCWDLGGDFTQALFVQQKTAPRRVYAPCKTLAGADIDPALAGAVLIFSSWTGEIKKHRPSSGGTEAHTISHAVGDTISQDLDHTTWLLLYISPVSHSSRIPPATIIADLFVAISQGTQFLSLESLHTRGLADTETQIKYVQHASFLPIALKRGTSHSLSTRRSQCLT